MAEQLKHTDDEVIDYVRRYAASYFDVPQFIDGTVPDGPPVITGVWIEEKGVDGDWCVGVDHSHLVGGVDILPDTAYFTVNEYADGLLDISSIEY